MINIALLLVVSIASIASGMSVVKGNSSLVWESLFAPPYSNIPATIIISLNCVDPKLCYIPGGANGVGFLVYTFDGQPNGNFVAMNEPNMTLMIMDIAMGGSYQNSRGAFGGVGMFGTISIGLQYLAAGGNWAPSGVPFELIFETESMRSTDNGYHIIAIDAGPTANGGQNGAMYYSPNAGQTFNELDINGLPTLKNCSGPGYAAMIDQNTWYITLGQFPENRKNVQKTKDGKIIKRKNRRLSIMYDEKTKEVSYHLHSKFRKDPEMMESLTDVGNYVCVGYAAEIAKTTDGGKTWKSQFVQNDTFTFNMIDCTSASHCVAVGDGDTAAYVYQTTDGTNWNRVLTVSATATSAVYFYTIRFLNATDVWIGGGYETQTENDGLFYFSKDGGQTWAQYPIMQPDVVQVMDLSFTQGEGFASGLTEFQTSTILRYADQPYYGYFTQTNCPFAGCTILCQNVTFPQGMCLPVQGGSAMAFCTSGGLEQQIYETTSCVGSYQTITMPVNQCLNSTDGSFFENFCNTQSQLQHYTRTMKVL